MILYGVDLGTDEPLVIVAKTIQQAREQIILYGVKKGYSKSWRENCNIFVLENEAFDVYQVY